MIAAAALFLAAATPTIETKAQWDNVQSTASNEIFEKSSTASNSSNAREPFAQIQAPPSYAPPTGEVGDGQKLPIHGGFWILIGLAVSYGIARREKRITELQSN